MPLESAPFRSITLADGNVWTEFFRFDNSYMLRFPGLADFIVGTGPPVVSCLPVPGVPPQTIEHLYLNQVLPLVMGSQDKMVFHASAVEINELAVAFAGDSGQGKSTLAASFAVAGFRFLTDDGLVVVDEDSEFKAVPSHPSVRLWQDSAQVLIAPETRITPAAHYTTKTRIFANKDIVFCDQPRRLKRVYFLGDGATESIDITPLRSSEALVEWVKHSFLLDIEDHVRLASHFKQVAGLANLPIHFRLNYPRRFEKLEMVREAIIKHTFPVRA